MAQTPRRPINKGKAKWHGLPEGLLTKKKGKIGGVFEN